MTRRNGRWALAAALCEQTGEAFPETRDEASETIERLRLESGHPRPRLSDVPVRPRRRRGRRSRQWRRVRVQNSERRASEVAA